MEQRYATLVFVLIPARYSPTSDYIGLYAGERNRHIFILVFLAIFVQCLIAGRSTCVDAFIVALNQTCEGGEKRWIESTLELQLASLEFCRACRSLPTLHVRVYDASPRSLWFPEQTLTRSEMGSSKRGVSTRVPVVRTLRLTWGLSMEALQQSATMETWIWLEVLELRGSSSAGNLETLIWPPGLKRLVLDTFFWTPLDSVSWPASLKHLSFGGNFNQRIAGVVWPSALEQLSFGKNISTDPSMEPCGRLLYNGYRSVVTSTIPSPELCGQRFYNSLRSGIVLTNPS